MTRLSVPPDVILMDDQRKAQPLLETTATIIAPIDINDEFYREMTWALISWSIPDRSAKDNA